MSTEVFFPISDNNVSLIKNGSANNSASLTTSDTSSKITTINGSNSFDILRFDAVNKRLEAPELPIGVISNPRHILAKEDGDHLYVQKSLAPASSTFTVNVSTGFTRFVFRNALVPAELIYSANDKRWSQSVKPVNASTTDEHLATMMDVKALLATAGGAVVGDVKMGMQSSDHSGWVLLDGRPVVSLPIAQRTALIDLGYTAPSLPAPAGRHLTGATSEFNRFGTTSGSATISRSNLPNVTITTSSNGAETITSGSTSAGTPSGTVSSRDYGTHSRAFAHNQGSGASVRGYGFDSIVGTSRRAAILDSAGSGSDIDDVSLNHNHTFTGNALSSHNHSVTTSNHTHTVSLNGGVTQQNYAAPQIQFNVFLYLG